MFKTGVRIVMTAIHVPGFRIRAHFKHHRKLCAFSCSHQKARHGKHGSLSYLRARVSGAYTLSLKDPAAEASYRGTYRVMMFYSTRSGFQNLSLIHISEPTRQAE